MADYYVNSATATGWVASTAITLGTRKVPSRAYATAAARAWTYECTTAGTTGTGEPTWPTTDGETVTDGDVVWTARIPSTWANASGHIDYIVNNRAAAGDRVFVGQAHSESLTAAYTITGKTNLALPISIICANTAAEPPTTLETTAQVTTSAANNIVFQNGLAVYGVNFKAGSGTSSPKVHWETWSTNAVLSFHNCLFEIGGSGADSGFLSGNVNNQVAGLVMLRNVRLKSAGTTAYGIAVGAQNRIIWDGGSIDTKWAHTSFIGTQFPRPGNIVIRGVDLSVLGSGKNLVNTANALVGHAEFQNCKLGASVNVVSGIPAGPGGINVMLHNCDSAATNYRYHSVEYMGQSLSETTVVKTGGSTDGTTAYSIRMVSSANAHYSNPLRHPVSAVWNDTTGSAITVTVDIIHDSTTALTDKDIWLDVEYLGTSTFPVSSTASDKAGVLTAATAQTASTVDWTTTGLTDPNKQKLEVTFTPNMKGYLLPKVRLAKPSYTVYVDNKAVIT